MPIPRVWKRPFGQVLNGVRGAAAWALSVASAGTGVPDRKALQQTFVQPVSRIEELAKGLAAHVDDTQRRDRAHNLALLQALASLDGTDQIAALQELLVSVGTN